MIRLIGVTCVLAAVADWLLTSIPTVVVDIMCPVVVADI